jgi:conjugal transfer/entry exclusion protein
VGDGANVANNEKRESVPWSLLITLIAVLITFFIVMPIMGYMYVDLINIREAWVVEVKKARKINKQLQEELWLRSNNSGN